MSLPAKQFSTQASCLADDVEDNDQCDTSELEGTVHLPSAFQGLLQSRRTTSRFTSLTSPIPVLEEQDYWRKALQRAVLCGYQAPNHKRTEPFTFKQMIAPSARTQRLSEIAYNVSLHQANRDKSLSSEQLAAKKEKARSKKDRWNRIPAFLVATVEEERYGENDLEPLDEYDQFPYFPPQTELALENYASTCAAVQNVLLSLHAENIATKWATGPIIRTPAFRNLIQAGDNDRVVALIMVGQASGPIPKSPRRLRRPLQNGSHNDILIDL
jgi:nitroreductase